MNMLNNNKGTVLLTMLMLLVIVTIIGLIAVNTTTVEIQILGNLKKASTAFEVTEAGIDLCIPIIESTIAAGTMTPTSFVVGSNTITLDSTLQTEIQNDQINVLVGPTIPPLSKVDVFVTNITVPNLAGLVVIMDIDRMYAKALAGGSLEFASGYEGIGAGAGGGGVGVLFKIGSRGTSL